MKRGQISIYIILGLLILLGISITLYVAQTKEQQPQKQVLKIPEQAIPVNEFITTCLTQIAKDGINKLGLQGGRIKIPTQITQTPTSYLSLDPLNNFKLPYWYYDGQDRTPSIEDMQNELSQYIQENSNMCIQQFNKFAPTTIEILDNIKPQTLITDNNVIFQITWQMAVKLADKTTTISDFPIELQVQLKKAWQLANSVMQTENQNTFFENKTIDFMSADDNIPTDGLVFECGPKKWYIPDIKTELQNLLHYNIPYIRVENTQYIPFTDQISTYNNLAKDRNKMMTNLEKGISIDQQTPPTNIPTDAYEYFKMKMNTGIPPTQLRASFSYEPNWRLMLAVEPNDGQVLRSNLGKGVKKYLPFICINQWHFAYDIIYPVKLTIKDDTAFLNKGYIFQTAFPVMINTNAPDRVFFGIQKFPTPSINGDFCSTPSNTIADIRAKGFEPDIPTAVELDNANITYRCFNQYCDLGVTKADDGYYRLRTMLPQGCNNPIITASKDGYLPAESTLTSNTLQLQLTRLRKINISILVNAYNLQDQQYIETTKQLQPNEKIALHVYLRNSTYDQYIEYPRDTQINMVDGKASYDIDALLTSNNVNIGGYFGQAINYTYEDMTDKNTLVINVLEIRPHPSTPQQNGEMTQYLYTNEDYQNKLKPQFQ